MAATRSAFALWCHGDSAIVAWGNAHYGGDNSDVRDQLRGVLQIQATEQAFAAILADGSVVTWGEEHAGGGDSSDVQDQLRGVQQIQATQGAFAGILEDGSVVTWGHADYGSDSSEVRDQLMDVQQIPADSSHKLNENRNLMWTKRGKACLILIFSTNTNCENMAYRSFRSEKYSALNISQT